MADTLLPSGDTAMPMGHCAEEDNGTIVRQRFVPPGTPMKKLAKSLTRSTTCSTDCGSDTTGSSPNSKSIDESSTVDSVSPNSSKNGSDTGFSKLSTPPHSPSKSSVKEENATTSTENNTNVDDDDEENDESQFYSSSNVRLQNPAQYMSTVDDPYYMDDQTMREMSKQMSSKHAPDIVPDSVQRIIDQVNAKSSASTSTTEGGSYAENSLVTKSGVSLKSEIAPRAPTKQEHSSNILHAGTLNELDNLEEKYQAWKEGKLNCDAHDRALWRTDLPDEYTWITCPEPHTQRRMAILKKYPQIRKLYGRDPWAGLFCICTVILQAVMAYLVRDQSWYIT